MVGIVRRLETDGGAAVDRGCAKMDEGEGGQVKTYAPEEKERPEDAAGALHSDRSRKCANVEHSNIHRTLRRTVHRVYALDYFLNFHPRRMRNELGLPSCPRPNPFLLPVP
jgi:hypothetical protein